MRLYRLLTLAASLAMLLPLSAQAAWPAADRAKFMDECLVQAKKNVSEADAQKHCTCSAKATESKFSVEEMKDVNSATPKGGELRARLLKEIDTQCPSAK